MKIHKSIKKTLGYPEEISDKEFKKSWKKRSTQVCKPCWELKYCPYGPFVEQSPLLPSTRSESDRHNEYLKNCLKTGMTGSIEKLSEERLKYWKEVYETAIKEVRLLIPFVNDDLRRESYIRYAEEKDVPLIQVFTAPIDNLHTYQVPFPLDKDEESLYDKVMKVTITPELQQRLDEKLAAIKYKIETGEDDMRSTLEPKRRELFEDQIAKYNADDHPDSIPDYVSELSCSIFGHICPVVFVGESITETSEERRRGRYISFKTKIRVVRRDNYTCQRCGRHLQDDEVEFDHIIPIAKGGSSEEHNIRLTCFDCNRDKSDRVEI